jgi:hypothetical protein
LSATVPPGNPSLPTPWKQQIGSVGCCWAGWDPLQEVELLGEMVAQQAPHAGPQGLQLNTPLHKLFGEVMGEVFFTQMGGHPLRMVGGSARLAQPELGPSNVPCWWRRSFADGQQTNDDGRQESAAWQRRALVLGQPHAGWLLQPRLLPRATCLQMEWSRDAFQAAVDAWLGLTGHQSPVPEFLARTEAIVDGLISGGMPAADDACTAAELMRHYLGGHLDRERLVSETSQLMLAGLRPAGLCARPWPLLGALGRLPAHTLCCLRKGAWRVGSGGWPARTPCPALPPAATETTATTLANTLHCLALRPEWQEAIEAELHQAGG